MKFVPRLALSLVLLLAQAATTIAAPACTLCISPNGQVCIDAPWADCTCCSAGCSPPRDNSPGVVSGDDEIACQTEHSCVCQCGHDNHALAALAAASGDSDSEAWQQPLCQCLHIPLIVAQDSQPASERSTVEDRLVKVSLPLPMAAAFACFFPVQHVAAPLPLPPPSGHLLTIACTVLRC